MHISRVLRQIIKAEYLEVPTCRTLLT